MLCYCVIEGCCLTLMELSHCTQCTAHTLHAVDCYITKFEHDATKYQITCNRDRKVERAKRELITLAMRLQLFYFSLRKRTAQKRTEQNSKTFAVMCFESKFSIPKYFFMNVWWWKKYVAHDQTRKMEIWFQSSELEMQTKLWICLPFSHLFPLFPNGHRQRIVFSLLSHFPSSPQSKWHGSL